jgi:hypothetical protein
MGQKHVAVHRKNEEEKIVVSLKRNSTDKPLEHQWEMPCRQLLQTSSWGFLRKS